MQNVESGAVRAPFWNQRRANTVLAIVAICWGSSYLLMKLGLDGIPPFCLIALRFCLAFLVLALLFLPKLIRGTTPRLLLHSSWMGVLLFGVFGFLVHGLQLTSTSNAGFLTSATVVLVPVFHAAITRKLPEKPILIGVVVTMFGIGLLTLQGSLVLHSGDLLCLCGAVVYAFQILLTDKLSRQEDGLLLGIWELGFAGLCGLLCSFLWETPVLPSTGKQWFAILGLALLCSAFGCTMQSVVQKYTTPEHTGLLFSLEPVVSAVFAYLFLRESMSFQSFVGAVLVMAGVIAASAPSAPHRKHSQARKVTP